MFHFCQTHQPTPVQQNLFLTWFFCFLPFFVTFSFWIRRWFWCKSFKHILTKSKNQSKVGGKGTSKQTLFFTNFPTHTVKQVSLFVCTFLWSSALTAINMTLNENQMTSSPVISSQTIQIFFQHFPPPTSKFSSFTLFASTVAIPSLSSSFFKTWPGSDLFAHFPISFAWSAVRDPNKQAS